MKRPVLVTGAAGFIGARFVEALNARGTPAVSVDEPEHFKDRPEHAGLDFGRIVAREDLKRWLESEKPKLHAVVHLGACADTTVMDRDFFKRMNTDFSKDLWSWCAAARVPLVYASSAATYGAGEHGFDDDEALLPKLKPLNPYGESKHLFDLWALAEEKAGRTPPAWSGFKFFNVYGFGERHKKKMASVAMHAYDQIRVTGHATLFRSHRPDVADGHQKRDFVAVEDVLDALLFAMEQPIPRGVYNLGSGKARTFLDLVRAVFAALGRPPEIRWVDTPESIRDKYQYFTEAAMGRLRAAGWRRPATALEDGVRAYIQRLESSR